MAIVTTNPNGPQVPSIFDIAGRKTPTVPTFSPATPPLVMFNWNGQLTECSIQAVSGPYQSLGKVPFPVEDCTVSFSQDIVQHKRPNVPGARVESTGFNPIMFKVRAPFLFNLQRGKGETWDNLYPSTFSKVFSILTDKVSPVLIFTHPTMGQFTVKPQSGSTSVSGSMRNGQVIEFELVQANEDNTSVSNITDTVPFGQAQAAATIFDNTIVTLSPKPPASVTSISLTKLLMDVRAAIDSTTLFINKVTNVVNNAIHQVKMIEDALGRLKTAATSGLITQLKRIKSGLHSLLNNQSTFNVPGNRSAAVQRTQAANVVKQVAGATSAGNLAVYTVPADMTLANVALQTHNSVDQLVKLNPSVSKSPTVKAGTQIIFQSTTGPSPRQ